jgi:hypothetical protein
MKTVYVCQACGKTAKKPIYFADVSCAVNAVPCDADSLVYDKRGRVVKAKAVNKPTKQAKDKEVSNGQ